MSVQTTGHRPLVDRYSPYLLDDVALSRTELLNLRATADAALAAAAVAAAAEKAATTATVTAPVTGKRCPVRRRPRSSRPRVAPVAA